MDVTDITKVASRKRMSEDAEKLRDKISRETAKIIKLKVAQDTAYWDIKEKLQQVESNHERLQQNMVEVQMQHETISGQYQDELRHRPELLNKASCARSVCAAVSEVGARVRASVGRARADRAALADCTRAAAARVRLMRAHAQRLHQHLHRAHHALRACSSRLEAAEREAAGVRAATEAAVSDARACAHALQAEHLACAERLRTATLDLHRKEVVIGDMQRETLRLEAELHARTDELERTVARHRAECEDAEQREASARRDADELRDRLQRLHRDHTETEARVDLLNGTVSILEEKNEQVTGELCQKRQELERRDVQIQELTSKLRSLETEKESLVRQVSAGEEELSGAHAQRQRLVDELAQHRRDTERVAADNEARLAAAGDTIARLMRDVQAEADARHRLELATKAKDEELARNLTLIVDINNENERLRGNIASMQATIDNIQKELTGGGPEPESAARRHQRPERPERPERLHTDDSPPLDRMLYNFLSDASNDADPHHSPLSLSQVKRDLSAKSRAFFKSKRCDTKHKKHK